MAENKMSQQEPREFFHVRDVNGGEEKVFSTKPSSDRFVVTTHVVEYSALLEAQAELKEAIEWKNHFMDLVEGETAMNERWQNENSKLQAEIADLKSSLVKQGLEKACDLNSIEANIYMLADKLKHWKSQADKLAEALGKSKGAMTYSYEDHSDQYYLNVKEEIEKALEAYAKFKEGK